MSFSNLQLRCIIYLSIFLSDYEQHKVRIWAIFFAKIKKMPFFDKKTSILALAYLLAILAKTK